MFKNQPKGLYALALANTGERFGYYTMLAIFLLFIQAKFGFSAAVATQIYSIFLAAVYFMPLFGGIFGRPHRLWEMRYAGYHRYVCRLSLSLYSDRSRRYRQDLDVRGIGTHCHRYRTFQRQLAGDGR